MSIQRRVSIRCNRHLQSTETAPLNIMNDICDAVEPLYRRARHVGGFRHDRPFHARQPASFYTLHQGSQSPRAQSSTEAIQRGVAKGRNVSDNPKLITVAGADIPLSPTLKSLGVNLDARLSFDNRVAGVCKACHFVYTLHAMRGHPYHTNGKHCRMQNSHLASRLLQILLYRHVGTQPCSSPKRTEHFCTRRRPPAKV